MNAMPDRTVNNEVIAKVVQIANDAIIIIDAGQRIVFANDGANRIFGYSQLELVGQPLDMLLPIDSVEVHRSHVRNFADSPDEVRMMGHQAEISGRRKDGSLFPAQASISKVHDGGEVLFAVIMQDITDHKNIEDRIKDQLHRLDALRKIDAAISSLLDLHSVLDVILEQTINQLGLDAASILLFNPGTQTFDHAAGKGFTTEALKYTHLHPGEGYAGKAAVEKRTISIPDLRGRKTDLLRSPFFLSEGFVSYFAVPLITKGQVKGILEIFQRSLLSPNPEWLDYLETLAGQSAIALNLAELFDSLERVNMELFMAYDETIEGWSHALDLRDKETEGHTRRVTEMAVRLAEAMGVSESEIINIRRGALLHDIGKMGVPDSILLKPDKLTEEEWKIMRQHPQLAYDMLSPIMYLRSALDIPYCHHEKWDGTGYPRGLKGEDIPLAARIFAVVDIWDALLSDRPYLTSWPHEKVMDYIQSLSGTHLDPRVVDTFLSLPEDRFPRRG